jgi:hypothetical protein
MPTVVSECPSCESSIKAEGVGRHCGLYSLTCTACCARLVASTRPDKAKALTMLAVIARQPGAPTRAEVLALLGDRN